MFPTTRWTHPNLLVPCLLDRFQCTTSPFIFMLLPKRQAPAYSRALPPVRRYFLEVVGRRSVSVWCVTFSFVIVIEKLYSANQSAPNQSGPLLPNCIKISRPYSVIRLD